MTLDGIEWLTPVDVAALLDRKPRTIRRWLRTGELRGAKPGGRWAIPRTAVMALLKMKDATK